MKRILILVLAAFAFVAYGKDDEKAPNGPVVLTNPTAPHILYWDAETNRMQVGAWGGAGNGATAGGKVSQANMIFALFGSTVGFLNNNDSWATNGSQIMFNPTDITNATMGAAFDTAIPHWENYAGGKSMADGYISGMSYHTAANVKAGFGDICKLAGLTANQVKAGTVDNKKYRLPMDVENLAYSAYTFSDIARGQTGYGVMIGSSTSTFLPAAGDRGTDGSTTYVYSDGCYWSSRPYSAADGYRLAFTTRVYVGYGSYARNGLAIRCVPQ